MMMMIMMMRIMMMNKTVRSSMRTAIIQMRYQAPLGSYWKILTFIFCLIFSSILSLHVLYHGHYYYSSFFFFLFLFFYLFSLLLLLLLLVLVIITISLSLWLQFCSWENPNFTLVVLGELLWQVAYSYTYELRPYMDLLLQILLLQDSWQNHRILNALKGQRSFNGHMQDIDYCLYVFLILFLINTISQNSLAIC